MASNIERDSHWMVRPDSHSRQVIVELLITLLTHVHRAPLQSINTLTEGELPEGHSQLLANYDIVFQMEIDGSEYTLLRSPLRNDIIKLPQHLDLSPRENEIIHLVARGMPNKLIASVLEISPWTVATHLKRVFDKLGVNTRAEMIAKILGSQG